MDQITTYQKCKNIRHSLLIRIGETLCYGWSNSFKIQNIEDIHNTLKKWELRSGSYKINPTDLTLEEMKELGFMSWSDESPIMLIPIWLYPFLANEFQSESIDGSKHSKLSELDTDHRFGCLAYGVIPK